jgi:cation:H+ antiporter
MAYEIALLVFYLIIIIAASKLFTNAVEALGARLKFSEGVTGSLFAAVGTALPETMVPLVAIFGGHSKEVSEEVGVGAILGAPFMLSTIAMALVGLSMWKFRGVRAGEGLTPERSGFKRDMEFSIFAFAIAFLVAFTPYEYRAIRVFVAIVLVLTYFYYVLETVKASEALVAGGHGVSGDKGLYLSRIFKEHMSFVVLQLLLSVALIIFGADGFVKGIKDLAEAVGMPVLALSLIIVPVATELPEKMNSILWIRRGRDTMAVGNITGAMVFQGSLLPAIGIFLTPWTVSPMVISSGVITILACFWLYALSARKGAIKTIHLVPNGVLYLAFLSIVLYNSFFN